MRLREKAGPSPHMADNLKQARRTDAVAVDLVVPTSHPPRQGEPLSIIGGRVGVWRLAFRHVPESRLLDQPEKLSPSRPDERNRTERNHCSPVISSRCQIPAVTTGSVEMDLELGPKRVVHVKPKPCLRTGWKMEFRHGAPAASASSQALANIVTDSTRCQSICTAAGQTVFSPTVRDSHFYGLRPRMESQQQPLTRHKPAACEVRTTSSSASSHWLSALRDFLRRSSVTSARAMGVLT